MDARTNTRRPAFSLVELVVVIVIIGIIAAMAIPRISRGSAGASDSTLMGSLAIVRNAINLYQAEHNNSLPTQAKFVEQLTLYTDLAGNENAVRTAAFPYGPYLLTIPACPVGDQSDPTDIAFDATNGPIPAPLADVGGWIYNTVTGEFRANTNATDANGVSYFTY